MMRRSVSCAWWLLPLASLSSFAAAASDGPRVGADYHSIQIASSPSAAVLERQFARYAALPYLRIERRGGLHVLRAGFWASAEEARRAGAARADVLGAAPLVRVSTYRPDAVVHGNWPATVEAAPRDAVVAQPAAAPAPVVPQPPPAVPAPARRVNNDAVLHDADHARMKPYDAADYALAFDVFLGSGDRERAFRVAQKAVASAPEDLDWRRKLARVAEWTQRPTVAWEQWEALFRRGDRSEETVNAVLRLAPLADRPDIALEAWGLRAKRESGGRSGTLSEAQWLDIFNLYEAGGKAREGSQFFEQQYRRNGVLRLLEYAAQLAENGGDDERAYRLYAERTRLKPFSQDAILRAAIFLLRRDRAREAYALMATQREAAPDEARDYWNLLANIALDLSDAKTAEAAMRRLGTSPQAVNADWARLIQQLRREHPERAADLALALYRRNGDTAQLLNALSLYAEQGNRGAQGRAFAALQPAALAALEKDARFLLLRARYHQLGQDPSRAWNDLRQALALQPAEDEIVVPVLWFLIDQHRNAELQPLLRRYAARAETTPAYWLAYAAAHHALDQYSTALRWYRKEIARARNADDSLLLLNYADALDRVQQGGMAERVRRHAWLKLREKFPQPALVAPLDANPELLALARLALLDAPGDPGLALVRKVVGELRGVPAAAPAAAAEGANATEAPADQQTRDLILGWAIAREQYPDARAWLWLNAARKGASLPEGAPLWGEAQTALQLDETQRMDRLLLEHADGLPIYNRYDTAYALEHWPQALDIAFRGMDASDVDEELHDRYRQHAPRHAHYVQLRAASETHGALDSRVRQYDLHIVAERRLHLDFGWAQFAQSSDDATLATPPRERLASVGAQWLGTHGDTTLAVFRRNELAGNTGWRATQNWAWNSHLLLNGAIERRAEATDSLPLRVGGSQDSLRLGFNYAIGKREYVAATQRLSRYHTQYDDNLGSGRSLDVEAGYRIRVEYPDWRARVFATTQDFSYNGAVGAQALARLAPEVRNAIAAGSLDAVRYFLPDDSTTVGACFGMGENLAGQNLQETYTRAWRHFYDVCTNRNNVNGAGYTGVIGVAGSLSGEDHLSLRLEQANGGTGAGTLSRMLAARYRHYF